MKKSLWQKVQLGGIGLALIITCMACSTILRVIEDMRETSPERPVEAVRPAPEPLKEAAPFIHTVKWRGESLSIIADWYTGDLENWEVLAQVNPHLNPNLIFKGNKIVIPENLLKTREPMPQDFLDKYVPRPEREEWPPREKAPEETAPFFHTVKWRGESLSIVAAWYTGDLENWEALAQANPDIDPNRIFKGDEILIPQNLLKTHDPMPQQFVEEALSETTLPPAEEEELPPPAEEEELPLFGPRP